MTQSENGFMWSYRNISSHKIHRRHPMYVNKDNMQSCYLDRGLIEDTAAACSFVSSTMSCYGVVDLFDYLKFLVCTGKINATFWGLVQLLIVFIAILSFWVAFMFLITKYFILPNIVHVAQYMRMPLYDFGVTVIAVIVSAPEITWIVQNCSNISSYGTLMLANMFGEVFTTYTIGLSVVCFGQHAKLPGGEVIKHLIISIVVFAFSYGLILSKLEEDFIGRVKHVLFGIRPIAFFLVVIYLGIIVYTIMTKRRQDRHSSVHSKYHHNIAVFKRSNGWTQLWHALNPFEHMQAPRYVIAAFAPLWVLSALQVPVIDKRRQMFGWCKYLTCLNIIIFPCLVYALIQEISIIFVGTCFLSLIMLIITILCTTVKEPPRYQGFFAVTGIFLGSFSYYVIEGEMETILWQSSTYIFNMQVDIIMLTGYTFHSILNVVIISYELVRMELGNLACGVIIGVTMNQIFFMLPIVTFQVCNSYDTIAAVSANTTTCFVFMMMTFIVSIFSMSMTNFKLGLIQGIFFASIYIIFFLFMILSGFDVIHPYGGFHTVSDVRQIDLADWA